MKKLLLVSLLFNVVLGNSVWAKDVWDKVRRIDSVLSGKIETSKTDKKGFDWSKVESLDSRLVNLKRPEKAEKGKFKKKKQPEKIARSRLQERSIKPERLKLSMIVITPEYKICLINGNTYTEGDVVNNCKILKITAEGVKLSCGKEEFFLEVEK